MRRPKPYSESLHVEGVIEAPIERVWAFRFDAAAQVEAYSRRLEVTPISGTWGEVGSVVRYVRLLDGGRTATTLSTVVEIDPPRRAVYDTETVETPAVRMTSTYAFEPMGEATRLTVDIVAIVARARGLRRLLLRWTQSRRRAEGYRVFALELAEENAYHRAHSM